MKRFIGGMLIALTLSACAPGEVVDNSSDSLYTWSYVDGPNGEHCLVASRWVGSDTGTAMMDCDWSTAR